MFLSQRKSKNFVNFYLSIVYGVLFDKMEHHTSTVKCFSLHQLNKSCIMSNSHKLVSQNNKIHFKK